MIVFWGCHQTKVPIRSRIRRPRPRTLPSSPLFSTRAQTPGDRRSERHAYAATTRNGNRSRNASENGSRVLVAGVAGGILRGHVHAARPPPAQPLGPARRRAGVGHGPGRRLRRRARRRHRRGRPRARRADRRGRLAPVEVVASRAPRAGEAGAAGQPHPRQRPAHGRVRLGAGADLGRRRAGADRGRVRRLPRPARPAPGQARARPGRRRGPRPALHRPDPTPAAALVGAAVGLVYRVGLGLPVPQSAPGTGHGRGGPRGAAALHRALRGAHAVRRCRLRRAAGTGPRRPLPRATRPTSGSSPRSTASRGRPSTRRACTR